MLRPSVGAKVGFGPAPVSVPAGVDPTFDDPLPVAQLPPAQFPHPGSQLVPHPVPHADTQPVPQGLQPQLVPQGEQHAPP